MLHTLLFPARFSWTCRQTLDIFFVVPLQEVALIFMTLWNWRDCIMIFAKISMHVLYQMRWNHVWSCKDWFSTTDLLSFQLNQSLFKLCNFTISRDDWQNTMIKKSCKIATSKTFLPHKPLENSKTFQAWCKKNKSFCL